MISNDEVLNQPTVAAPPAEKQRIVTANSVILFLLAYLTCYFAAQFATLLAAFSAKIPTVFYPGHLEFKIPDSAWRVSDIISVYSAGPVTGLVLAFFAGLLFLYFRWKRGLPKTYLLWTMLHGCNLFFGALIAGTVVKGGFWYALRWSGFSDDAVWIVAIFFGLILLGIGVLAAPAFLLSCDSISLMEYQNRGKMLAATVMRPWLLGSLLLALLQFPDLQPINIMLIFTMLLVLLPAYFLNQQNLYSETIAMPKKTRLAQGAFILLIFVALTFRLVLQNGMHFG